MRIPTHLQQLVNNLGLKGWVDGKQFPIDHYSESVELYRERLSSRTDGTESGEGEIQKAIAIMVAQELDVEGALATLVLDGNVCDISDEAQWAKICEAAGWCVLQRCERIRKRDDD
jgi:hypothetical protein